MQSFDSIETYAYGTSKDLVSVKGEIKGNNIKLLYTLKIHMKQESTGLKRFNNSKALLNIQMIWMIFLKTLKNTTQIRNIKY